MKLFKYCCAFLALVYFVYAFLPSRLVVAELSGAEAITPEWVGRAFSIEYSLLFSAMFYGIQTRKRIFWRLIPVLLGILLLSVVIPAFWGLFRLSLPWVPFIFVVVFILISLLIFIAWWRSQKNYFVA